MTRPASQSVAKNSVVMLSAQAVVKVLSFFLLFTLPVFSESTSLVSMVLQSP